MTILIIEDEPKIAKLLSDYLEADGFDCQIVSEGTDAVSIIRVTSPEFIILDLMLPGKDGLTICRETRAFSDVPILILTAKVDEIDRLLGLELGADDYVCKPFSPREIVSRVRTILRRVNRTTVKTEDDYTYEKIRVFPELYSATFDGEEVELTPVEFRMLCLLVGSPGRVFSRQQLMTAAYDDDRIVSQRTIDSHVKNLRKKLAAVSGEEKIRSIYGVGYKLE